jgi:hypothetical protein
MNSTRTWLDGDSCPLCGAGLHLCDDGAGPVAQKCPACGWTAITDVAARAGGSR